LKSFFGCPTTSYANLRVLVADVDVDVDVEDARVSSNSTTRSYTVTYLECSVSSDTIFPSRVIASARPSSLASARASVRERPRPRTNASS
jgi:activator of HSP90 ATPase